jgi:Subtilase family
MRIALLIGLLISPQLAWADRLGELLWEPDIDRSLSLEMLKGNYPFVPHLPIGGRSDPTATKVAIIDTGVAKKHPQLSGFILASTDFTGEGSEDILGHGTMVALVALNSLSDLGGSVQILSAKVVGKNEKVLQSHVISAINWAVSSGARVINMSIGFKGTRDENKLLCDAIHNHRKVLFFCCSWKRWPYL